MPTTWAKEPAGFRGGSGDYVYLMAETERYFYHSFPRRPGADHLKKGLIDYGPHALRAPPRSMDMAQPHLFY